MGKTTVALKIINRFSSQDVMDQFEDEMSIMSQFYHRNIVKVFGILREGSHYRVSRNICYVTNVSCQVPFVQH